MKKSLLTAAVALTLASGAAQSATLVAGQNYNINILADGVSCFTFGDCTTVPTSAFADNDTDALAASASADLAFGSAIAGDGLAGVINISTTDDGAGGVNFTVNSYNMDTYLATAGGAFATQGTNVATMSGSVDAAGNISMDLTGREGVAQFFGASIGIQAWNTGSTFTTGSQTNAGATTLTGSTLDASGFATIISASEVGPDWALFANTPYTEQFSVQIVAAVPVPAAVWLFGSGLLGLVGVARRKKSA